MQSFYFKKLQVVPKKELKLLWPPRSTLYCLLAIKNHSKNQPFRDKVMTNNVSFSNLLQITKGFSLQITTNFLQIATGITNYDRAHNYLTVPIGCFLLVGTIDVALHVTIVFAPAARGFRLEGEIPRRHSSSLGVYEGKYLQLKYTVSMPEQISICLNRGRMEPFGNDDVSIVRARKWEMVRMT